MLQNVCLSPTRENNILGLIITHIIYSVEIEEPLANSDHNSVRIEMRIPVKRVNEYPRTIYLYSKGDYENINGELDQISLNKYDPNRDMDTNWRHFREVYQILINKYVPRKVIKVGQRFKAPWMKDSQAKRSKKKKRKLWLKYNTSGLNTDKYQYSYYVNEHKKNMYEAKGRYEGRLINSFKDNPKRFYNYARMFTKY